MKRPSPINHHLFLLLLLCTVLVGGALVAEGIFWLAMWYAGV